MATEKFLERNEAGRSAPQFAVSPLDTDFYYGVNGVRCRDGGRVRA
jgi:hypothetical protein